MWGRRRMSEVRCGALCDGDGGGVGVGRWGMGEVWCGVGG